MDSTTVAVGEFVEIPAWRVGGQVVALRPAMLGSEAAVEMLIETRPDDPKPRWYRCEPSEYVVVS